MMYLIGNNQYNPLKWEFWFAQPSDSLQHPDVFSTLHSVDHFFEKKYQKLSTTLVFNLHHGKKTNK